MCVTVRLLFQWDGYPARTILNLTPGSAMDLVCQGMAEHWSHWVP
jgi:hypothetical protein